MKEEATKREFKRGKKKEKRSHIDAMQRARCLQWCIAKKEKRKCGNYILISLYQWKLQFLHKSEQFVYSVPVHIVVAAAVAVRIQPHNMYIAPTFKLMMIIHFDVVNSMRNATSHTIKHWSYSPNTTEHRHTHTHTIKRHLVYAIPYTHNVCYVVCVQFSMKTK